jgi:hypothetical protein
MDAPRCGTLSPAEGTPLLTAFRTYDEKKVRSMLHEITQLHKADAPLVIAAVYEGDNDIRLVTNAREMKTTRCPMACTQSCAKERVMVPLPTVQTLTFLNRDAQQVPSHSIQLHPVAGQANKQPSLFSSAARRINRGIVLNILLRKHT